MPLLRAFLLFAILPLVASSQEPPGPKVELKGTAAVADQWQAVLSTQLEGQIALRNGEKTTLLDLKAKAEHKLDERVLKVSEGAPAQVVRYYHDARADIVYHQTPQARRLRPERRTQVAEFGPEGSTVVYSLNGPLTREELDLCGEHANILALRSVLPGKVVALGDSWEVPLPTAQALAGVEGVIESNLTAKLEKLDAAVAVIAVTGTVEGIQLGAEAKVELKISVEYHHAEKRFMQADWRQRRTRGPGPVNPQSLVESATRVVWTQPYVSTELLDAVAAQVPAEPTAAHLVLEFRDQKGRFTFLHERTWQVVANSAEQVVLRCLERGELLGQLNLRPWTSTRPGAHLDPKELHAMATQTPGFTIEKTVDHAAVAAPPGYWIYRISLVGQANEISLAQSTYAIAGPHGDQAILTFSCEVEQGLKFAGKDLAIVKAFEFPAVVQAGSR